MNIRKIWSVMWSMICLAAVPGWGFADIVLPPVLSSHMVLQRDRPVPVWGTAAPGEQITVEFAGQKKTAVADAQGTQAPSKDSAVARWKVILDPMPASSEPRTMVVAGASGKKELTDILVGEVWVGSGQSNMQQGGGSYTGHDEVIAKMISAGPYPQLRLISSGAKGWMESTPENLKGFSAMLFSFGLPLHKELKVPVGLLVGAVGGTPSGFWLSQQAYDNDQACQDVVAKSTQDQHYAEALKKYEASLEKWKQDVEEAKTNNVPKLPKAPQKPIKPGECKGQLGHLYERHIRPYIPYAIRGVLWDQGESGTAIEGIDQYTLMGALIKGWRKEWGQDFPFIYVQKPSGGGCAWDPADPVTCRAEKFTALPGGVPSDGKSRAVHIRIMTYPATFMVTSSDLGSGVHPVNKSGYGARGARVALGAVYGRNVEIYGPVYKAHKLDGGKVIVSFDHVGQGLAVRKNAAAAGSTPSTGSAPSTDSINSPQAGSGPTGALQAGPGPGKLQGFAVAGEDGPAPSQDSAVASRKWVWADAVIEGNTVVVSSAKVAKPVAVRYAWAGTHPWANLFNKDGLPALPFRTDGP